MLKYREQLEAGGRAPLTVNLTIKRVLKRAFKVAIDEGLISRNPCSTIRPIRDANKVEKGTFSPQQISQLVEHAEGDWKGLILAGENGKVKHSTHGRITGLTLEQLKLLQAAFRGDVVPKGSAEDFQILASKEYGASYALLELAKELGLDRALYSRKEALVQDCLAMIVGRIVYAGSKLALSNQWKKHRSVGTVGRGRQSRCGPPLLSPNGSASGAPERDPAYFGSSSSPGWSPGALRHYQQLL